METPHCAIIPLDRDLSMAVTTSLDSEMYGNFLVISMDFDKKYVF